jgi:hypothetical protein
VVYTNAATEDEDVGSDVRVVYETCAPLPDENAIEE